MRKDNGGRIVGSTFSSPTWEEEKKTNFLACSEKAGRDASSRAKEKKGKACTEGTILRHLGRDPLSKLAEASSAREQRRKEKA